MSITPTGADLKQLFESAREDANAFYKEQGALGYGSDAFEFALRKVFEAGRAQPLTIHIAAINADRAQRTVSESAKAYRNGGFDNTVAAALYDALTDRETDEADAAAEWVAENENDLLWDRHIGPLMDDLEREAAR